MRPAPAGMQSHLSYRVARQQLRPERNKMLPKARHLPSLNSRLFRHWCRPYRLYAQAIRAGIVRLRASAIDAAFDYITSAAERRRARDRRQRSTRPSRILCPGCEDNARRSSTSTSPPSSGGTNTHDTSQCASRYEPSRSLVPFRPVWREDFARDLWRSWMRRVAGSRRRHPDGDCAGSTCGGRGESAETLSGECRR